MANVDRKQLEEIIRELFNISTISSLINTQITKLVTTHGYSYLDIARALCYFVEKKQGKLDLKYGIGIVPHIMKESDAYYSRLKSEKEKQQKQIQEIKKENKKQKVIFITKTKETPIKKKQIDLKKLNIER